MLDQFGLAATLDGDTLAVSDGSMPLETGRVPVFARVGATWTARQLVEAFPMETARVS